MSLAILYTRASSGINAPLVTVETHLTFGTGKFHIVGLPEMAVKESKHRVLSALLNSNFEFPYHSITVNLAPADLPKEGGRFDLPIALGILAASGQITIKDLTDYEFFGELALSGELRRIDAIIPILLNAVRSQKKIIIPAANASEAGLIDKPNILSANHLLEVCDYLKGGAVLPRCEKLAVNTTEKMGPDFSEIKGQNQAKKALEIAAAGQHNILLLGPPGTGKTMLATRLPTIIPEVTEHQALEIASIASLSRSGFDLAKWQQHPFRAPHHTSSSVALVGGGRPPRPGEISLAHHGILFLDEFPEFHRHVLEALREPLESGSITISRADAQMIFPAQFQLIAAMNPCPCGYAGSQTKQLCRCHAEKIKKYRAKVSGPLLDRIDMHVEVGKIDPALLEQAPTSESSIDIKARVMRTRRRQYERQGKLNQLLSVAELEQISHLTEDARNLLNVVVKKFNLSMRAYHRIIKVALTISDLAESDTILQGHISEAVQYRTLDKQSIT